MGRERQKWRKFILICGMILTAWLFSAALGRRMGCAVFEYPEISIDDRSREQPTSSSYRYGEKFKKTLCRYEGFRDMYQEEKSIAVPGLMYTRLGNSGSGQMVPQGICIAGEYMLITAYDREKRQNSVIYVLSGENDQKWKYVTAIVLPDRNHVGGIAFDGENIWIAKSTSGYLSVFSLKEVEKAVLSGEDSYLLEKYTENVYCGVTASFVTWYRDRLWVGTYRSGFNPGKLTCYRPVRTENGFQLQKTCSLDIPALAQGVAFLEEDGGTFMVLSTSGGRYRDSVIFLYEAGIRGNQVSLSLQEKYHFPPMSEELVSDGESVYILFESAATCYSTENYRKCMYPVDRVCALSGRKLLERARAKARLMGIYTRFRADP